MSSEFDRSRPRASSLEANARHLRHMTALVSSRLSEPFKKEHGDEVKQEESEEQSAYFPIRAAADTDALKEWW